MWRRSTQSCSSACLGVKGREGGLKCRWASAGYTHAHPLSSQELFLLSHNHSFVLPASQPTSKHLLRTYCTMLVAKPPIGPLMLDILSDPPTTKL